MTGFRQRYGPWGLVAGASEGIGRAWCRRLAERGLDVVLIARRAELLEEEAAELRARFGVQTRTLALDLASPDLGESLRQSTDDLDVGFVVYNAAYSEIGEYLGQGVPGKLRTLDVNCRGVVLLTSHFAERLVARGRGGMVLMSSMAGWQGSALVGVYAASKAFVTVLAESLWSELRPHGVDVHACVAGATLTPSFESQTPDERRRQAFPMQPEAVVDAALARLGKGPTIVTGRVNRVVHVLLSKLLSRRAAVSFFSRTTRGIYGGTGAK
jgi:short-subunit dehydrogenase